MRELKQIQDAYDEAGCKVEYYGDEYGFTVRFYRHCDEGWGTDMGANGSASKGLKVQNEPLEEPLEMKIKRIREIRTTGSDFGR
ncbi:MAG: hypothetical protein LIP10_00070 [Clostridiales bacterium]|nr:hypothetical protein [Clostridiales bacterium]